MTLGGAFFGAVWLGWRLAGRRVGLSASVGVLVLSITPIALAYHFAHYLASTLVEVQYLLVVLSDPLGTGADLLGLGRYFVSTSFLTTLDGATAIWRAQSAAIIGGHLMAAAAAHVLALRLYGDTRGAVLAQVPLALLMVAYTAFGLWLLATPTGA